MTGRIEGGRVSTAAGTQRPTRAGTNVTEILEQGIAWQESAARLLGRAAGLRENADRELRGLPL